LKGGTSVHVLYDSQGSERSEALTILNERIVEPAVQRDICVATWVELGRVTDRIVASRVPDFAEDEVADDVVRATAAKVRVDGPASVRVVAVVVAAAVASTCIVESQALSTR
jgi:hypothetical protein